MRSCNLRQPDWNWNLTLSEKKSRRRKTNTGWSYLPVVCRITGWGNVMEYRAMPKSPLTPELREEKGREGKNMRKGSNGKTRVGVLFS